MNTDNIDKYLNKKVWALYPKTMQKAPGILLYKDEAESMYVFWCGNHERGFIAPEFSEIEGYNYETTT